MFGSHIFHRLTEFLLTNWICQIFFRFHGFTLAQTFDPFHGPSSNPWLVKMLQSTCFISIFNNICLWYNLVQ